jgi:UTP:GlnB (protein PII) uridylyltransferase
VNEVMVVCRDMKCLLTAITVAMASLGQSIVDADIVTTTDGMVVDRFVVTSSEGEWAPLTSEQLKQRIELQLATAMGVAPPIVDTSVETSSGTASHSKEKDDDAGDEEAAHSKRVPDFKVMSSICISFSIV